jgi:hypothetical protein
VRICRQRGKVEGSDMRFEIEVAYADRHRMKLVIISILLSLEWNDGIVSQ